MVATAAIIISLALLFYSIGVWWERMTGMLRGRQLLFFWLGFACDSIGTGLMARVAGPAFQPGIHGVTGVLAILLMLLHALWGTLVHAGRREEPKRSFHRLSVVVWGLWLIPYVSGMFFGMSRAGAVAGI